MKVKSEEVQKIACHILLFLVTGPLALFWPLLVFSFFDVSILHIVYFSFAYAWHLFLLNPTDEKKATESEKYRFSFARFCFRLNSAIFSLFKKIPGYGENFYAFAIIRSLSPLLIVVLMFVIFHIGQEVFIFSLSGSFVCELVHFYTKDYLKAQEKD